MNLFSFIFSKIFFKNLLYALVGVLVLTGFFVLWLSFYTSHSNFVEVPDVRGKMPEEVMEQLDDMGLGFEIIDGEYNGVTVQIEKLDWPDEGSNELALDYHVVHKPELITDEDIKSDTFKAVVEVIINDILREAINEFKQTGNNDSKESSPQ